jgi:hypothetical protein
LATGGELLHAMARKPAARAAAARSTTRAAREMFTMFRVAALRADISC